MTTSDPLLPPEIEEPIFQLCAASEPKMISVLLRVANRVKEWLLDNNSERRIEPLRFRTVHFKDMEAVLLCTLVTSKPPPFLAQHVKHFILGHSVSRFDYDWAARLLLRCTGILDLGVFTGGDRKIYTELTRFPHIRYLTLDLSSGRNFIQFLKDNASTTLPITHFYSNWQLLLSLELLIPSQLPNLSYIAGEWPNDGTLSGYRADSIEVVARMVKWNRIQLFVLCIHHAVAYDIRDDAQSTWNHPKVVPFESDWGVTSFENRYIGKLGTTGFWNTAEGMAQDRNEFGPVQS
ncbi:hypothetical protein DL96DRAFT_1687162 [Flagelloscypha sp. PMI_526]|nr:hypothetical protein DL96DRAFT_1687162 [Flagelloscypha sp. PMI_526]